MASQLSMWKDDDPERYAEDGGGMKRPKAPRRNKAGGTKKRSRSAASRRTRTTKPQPARPKKPKRSRSSPKKPRAELPKSREYKTQRGARYILSRVED